MAMMPRTSHTFILVICILLTGLSVSIRRTSAHVAATEDADLDPVTSSLIRGLLRSIHLGGTLASNCGGQVDSDIQELKKASNALPNKIDSLDVAMPFLYAVMTLVKDIGHPDCLTGAAEPMPPQLTKAMVLIGGASLSGPVVGETLAFVTKCRVSVDKGDFVAIGNLAGDWLQTLASYTGGLPMLEGLAQALGESEENIRRLTSCASATKTSMVIVKSMQSHLSLPDKTFGRTRKIVYAKKLHGIAQLMESAQETLQNCIPTRLENDDRLRKFSEGIALIIKMVNKAEIMLGTDIAIEFQVLHNAAVAGDWKAVGTKIGDLVQKVSPIIAGVRAMSKFFQDIAGNDDPNPPKFWRVAFSFIKDFKSSIKECMMASKDLMGTFRSSFAPLDGAFDAMSKSQTVLNRLKIMIHTTQESLRTCNSDPVRKLEDMLNPEISRMGHAVDAALARASNDTMLLIQGLDVTEEANKFIQAVNSNEMEEAAKHLTTVLKMINDQVNMGSFLGSLLNTLDLGLDTLTDCMGDIHHMGDELKIAASALAIHPKKWTIDKGDCDIAMASLKQVVLISYEAANHCEHQLSALKELVQALAKRQWEIMFGKIQMFKENVAVRFFELGKAVARRDWIAAGAQVAALALKALDVLEGTDSNKP